MNQLGVRNPRNGALDYRVSAWTDDDIGNAATRLQKAQRCWSESGLDARIDVLDQFKSCIAENFEEIASALAADTGRIFVSRFEVSATLNVLDFWLNSSSDCFEPIHKATSKFAPSVEFSHALIPYALVGVISPWNFPLLLSMIDTIPALLAGCSVIVKPSEITPRFIQPIQAAIDRVDTLKGVLQFIVGDAATGQALVNHVDAVCFTGSVATGKSVAVQAASQLKPAFLELGGKDPAIVMASANLEHAVDAILRSAVGMTGQSCQSIERVYVQERVFTAFLHRLVQAAAEIRYNWPNISSGQIGPLISAMTATKIASQIEQAQALGARVHCGGIVERHDAGYWMAPTIVTDLPHDCELMQEETFGPVIPIMPFKHAEDAVNLANDSRFGLSAAVFSGDIDEATNIAKKLVVGAVSINDASLTAIVNDVEKNSFRQSGLGGSRMGNSGLTRFLRKRALLFQNAAPTKLAMFSEAES
ncbi:MAG: aldehyde dehydrogenase family protein [Gammaproteobacteria bacterium]|nr:aldehyde dehydrogenase family protein [Gammaproteobacteria bacterium]